MAYYEDPLGRLVGSSPAMQAVRDRITRIASARVPVLILGETGTGKELCAEAVAALSGRRPFLPVNCAAIAENLVESELFGHERGAFTGAVRAQEGVIASADGGTLFLDELAEIPRPVQVKLLRTLETGEYTPVGASQRRQSDFRILAATNEHPDRLVAEGRLRADLLHRLGATRIELPALRDRREDIPLLVEAMLRRYAARAGMPAPSVAPDVVTELMHQPWPGNARELRNVVEATAALAGNEPIVARCHLAEVITPVSLRERSSVPTLAEVRRRAELRAISDALEYTGGNREAAARLLRISPATLYRKLTFTPDKDG